MEKTQLKSKLQQQAAKLPLNPGVYFFVDKNNRSLYIGRATSLKKRVSQYFRNDLDPRIAEMVPLAKKIKHQKTETLLDAIILEANLIKKYWPKYNVKDRDDRSFVYVVIPKKDFAYPLIVRQRDLKKFPAGKADPSRHRRAEVEIFGPYQNATLLKNALRIIRRIFPYGTCRPNSGHTCFDYQVGLCPGSCLGLISKSDYNKNIKNISLIFNGKKKQLINKLKKDKPEAVKALKQIQDVTLITKDELSGDLSQNRIEGYDISHLSGKETVGAMAVFVGGQPDKAQYRLFNIKSAAANDDLRALEEMVSRRLNHQKWPLPDIFLVDGGRPQVDFVQKILQIRNINLPLIGISKLGGDRLVFGRGAKKPIRELAENLKGTLLEVRDEAHRFANAARRRKTTIR
ncbi:MAG: GIY-YIG nuclease family protein [Patescibacteria group bacterium]